MHEDMHKDMHKDMHEEIWYHGAATKEMPCR